MVAAQDDKPQTLIPCFLCGYGCEVRYTKRNKPYFVCDPCGTQIFIRGKKGIGLFQVFLENTKKVPANYFKRWDNFDVIGLTERLSQLNAKIQEIKDDRGLLEVFFPDEQKDLAIRAIEKESAYIQMCLQKLFRTPDPQKNEQE